MRSIAFDSRRRCCHKIDLALQGRKVVALTEAFVA
jgi:hypothetical protein